MAGGGGGAATIEPLKSSCTLMWPPSSTPIERELLRPPLSSMPTVISDGPAASLISLSLAEMELGGECTESCGSCSSLLRDEVSLADDPNMVFVLSLKVERRRHHAVVATAPKPFAMRARLTSLNGSAYAAKASFLYSPSRIKSSGVV